MAIVMVIVIVVVVVIELQLLTLHLNYHIPTLPHLHTQASTLLVVAGTKIFS